MRKLTGEPFQAGEYRVGDFFSDLDLPEYRKELQFLRMIQPGDLLRISKEHFADIIAQEAGLALYLLDSRKRQLQAQTLRLFEQLIGETRSSIGKKLVELARDRTPDGKYIIRPAPVIADLARYYCVRRETVSRILTDLTKKNLITRIPGAIILNDPDALLEE